MDKAKEGSIDSDATILTFAVVFVVFAYFAGMFFSFNSNFKMIAAECEKKSQVVRLIDGEYIAIECKKVTAQVQIVKPI